jgi:DUF1707 SHOCT-like domain
MSRPYDGAPITISGMEPLGPDRYRVSDSDREQVAETLRLAAGEGRLSIDELEQRLEQAYAAKTYGELVPLTHDLPASGGSRQPATRAAAQPQTRPTRVGGVASAGASIAIFGGAQRKGAWVVPESYTAFAMFGGVELDLREASLAAPEVTINAVAIMGGVDITVPMDVRVVVDGIGILGGFDQSDSYEPAPGAPVVRVKGAALMGGVAVKRKPSKRPR